MKIRSVGEIRRKVIWLGTPPDSAAIQEFTSRGLIIDKCADAAIAQSFPLSAGIVFRFDSEHKEQFAEHLKEFGSGAINHGLLPVTLSDNDQAFLEMDLAIQRMRLPFETTKKVGHRIYEVAELIARHDPGPGQCEVEVLGERISSETQLFLCRAFHDCKSITISRLTDGRSADVFSVYALFRDSRVGPRPLPFFAKIDKRSKILNEWSSYQNIVGHFIPFHARPDLEPERCLIGVTHGILVGNFVEQSESLWSVAKRGAAQSVIYSLFDEALRGWRLQAYAQDEASAFALSLFDSLKRIFEPQRPVFAERAKNATAFGTVSSPHEILDALNRVGSIKHRVAPQHGDLHVHNVRARRGEAILIDFNSTTFSGPLVADPASLEVSLVFEVDPSDSDNEGWRELVERLYKPEYLHRAPPPPNEPAPREWMWACVRQVRLFALESQTTDREYQLALIFYLLRRASFRDESGSDKYRRDYAYYLASRLTGDFE